VTWLVNTAAWWVQLAIDVNNAFCGAFGAGPPPNLADTLAKTTLPVDLLVGLIYVVMGLLLVLQQLMRLALVDILLILAPLAAVSWILPHTHGWGRLWGTPFIGTVFAQAVQVLTLRVGVNLATDIPPANASGLVQPGFLATQSGIVGGHDESPMVSSSAHAADGLARARCA
jgi:hypothetical protein